MHIANIVSHKHVKSRQEIRCNLGSTKMTNLIKFEDLKTYFYRSRHLLFLYRSVYKVFEFGILHVCVINHGLHEDIFFNFFKTQKNMILNFLKQQEHWSSGAQNPHSGAKSCFGTRASVLLPRWSF
jgi:hypothetical protein